MFISKTIVLVFCKEIDDAVIDLAPDVLESTDDAMYVDGSININL